MKKDAGFFSCVWWLAATLFLFTSLAPAQDDKKDFSRTNAVAIVFGESEIGTRVSGHGLEHRSYSSDGITKPENVQGISCRSLHLTERGVPKGYFFFTIDPSFKNREISRVKIEVEYFDGLDLLGPVFGVQYDAKGSDENRALTVKQILPARGQSMVLSSQG